MNAAGLLGDLDECARLEQAALRVLPAHERLEPLHRPVAQRHDRLVGEAKLAALHCTPQAALELHALQRPLAHRLVEYLEAAATPCLRKVQGGVGVAEWVDALVRALRHERDPDARRHHDVLAGNPEGLGHPLQEALGDRRHVVLARHVLAQEAELVSAEACGGVTWPHRALQALAECHQQIVAGRAPVAVVDVLEVIEAEQDHADGRPVCAGALERTVEPVLEQCAIRQAGERVVHGQVPRLHLEGFSLDRASEHVGDGLQKVSVIGREVACTAVGRGEQAPLRLAGGDRRGYGRRQVGWTRTETRDAPRPPVGLVPLHGHPCHIQRGCDLLGGGLHDRSQVVVPGERSHAERRDHGLLCGARLHAGVGVHLLGHVERRADEDCRYAVRCFHRPPAVVEPAHLAVGPHDAVALLEGAPGDHRFPGHLHACAVVDVDDGCPAGAECGVERLPRDRVPALVHEGDVAALVRHPDGCRHHARERRELCLAAAIASKLGRAPAHERTPAEAPRQRGQRRQNRKRGE